jgi:hypothetical protein
MLDDEGEEDEEEASNAGENGQCRVKKARAPLDEEEEELRRLILEGDEFGEEREEDQLDQDGNKGE